MTPTAAWIVGLMVALEPRSPWRATYERTAEAIARVAEEAPLFDGDAARTAALLVSVAWHESRLRPDAKSANGRWLCLYQVDKRHVADPSKLLEDPEACTRAAMTILRASLTHCRARPERDRLAFFMSGACDKGLPQSRYRMFLASKLLREHPAPAKPG
jgi:hypothetical protein